MGLNALVFNLVQLVSVSSKVGLIAKVFFSNFMAQKNAFNRTISGMGMIYSDVGIFY